MVRQNAHFGHLGYSGFTLYLTVLQRNATKMALFWSGTPVVIMAMPSHHALPRPNRCRIFIEHRQKYKNTTFFGLATTWRPPSQLFMFFDGSPKGGATHRVATFLIIVIYILEGVRRIVQADAALSRNLFPPKILIY